MLVRVQTRFLFPHCRRLLPKLTQQLVMRLLHPRQLFVRLGKLRFGGVELPLKALLLFGGGKQRLLVLGLAFGPLGSETAAFFEALDENSVELGADIAGAFFPAFL